MQTSIVLYPTVIQKKIQLPGKPSNSEGKDSCLKFFTTQWCHTCACVSIMVRSVMTLWHWAERKLNYYGDVGTLRHVLWVVLSCMSCVTFKWKAKLEMFEMTSGLRWIKMTTKRRWQKHLPQIQFTNIVISQRYM